MNKSTILAGVAIAAMFAAPAAFAKPGNNGGGNGGCGQGQQTNGCGGSNPTATGGAATAGALGLGVGIGTGGSATATGGAALGLGLGGQGGMGGKGGNASVRTSNSQGQGQEQGQGQTQSNLGLNLQGQQVRDSGNSASSSHVSNAGNSTNALSSSSDNANNAKLQAENSVVVEGDQYEAQRRNPVASAYAAPLSIGGGVCMYTPASASGQFVGFGFSGSAAKRDDECDRRAFADMFARIGKPEMACEILMANTLVIDAARRSGFSCQASTQVSYAPAEPKAPAYTPLTMAPIPNPVPVNQGQKG